jgi:hypothetical protein
MARIIGAIASSHTPTIGFAFDQRKQTDPLRQPKDHAAPGARENNVAELSVMNVDTYEMTSAHEKIICAVFVSCLGTT